MTANQPLKCNPVILRLEAWQRSHYLTDSTGSSIANQECDENNCDRWSVKDMAPDGIPSPLWFSGDATDNFHHLLLMRRFPFTLMQEDSFLFFFF
ncbi:hypothetical protein CDAR_535651 [Caerostris darwini]|uniref:Uncharacterized protein n=1 Tax=Caerostris darwini TaxID=1538125 RepID=A0AAV4QQ90_9ARAC|nr:hypothetical protein CDAR_535651 [Caerostris darwini]